MVAALSAFGHFSGYLPRESGQVVAFVRRKEEFKLNEYIQYVPVEADLGVYRIIERDAYVRMPDSGDQFSWEDGNHRPSGRANKLRYQMDDYRTKRKDFPWELGYKTLKQSKNFDLKVAHMDMAISQAMTELTLRVWNKLQSSSTWGGNTKDANTLNGGKGKFSTASDDPSDPHYNAVFLALSAAAQEINLSTNGKVKPTDLVCIFSPTSGRVTAASAEITNYCRESPAARDILEKGMDPQYALWGLPAYYKGFRLLVEDAPIVTEYPKADGTQATTNRTRIKNDSEMTILTRIGGIDGEAGSPNMTTCQAYHYDSLMKVAAFDDPKNELVEGHVSTDIDVVVPAAISGYRVTNIL